ncbi:hypothetical protein COO60DRAFT_1553085 [Scenedesmus sp. NREL 46B-D3]|nr:hypothetical protein COO60DRAFT_1553085 [Scenedesmus sp. NREL 46B-D3]
MRRGWLIWCMRRTTERAAGERCAAVAPSSTRACRARACMRLIAITSAAILAVAAAAAASSAAVLVLSMPAPPVPAAAPSPACGAPGCPGPGAWRRACRHTWCVAARPLWGWRLRGSRTCPGPSARLPVTGLVASSWCGEPGLRSGLAIFLGDLLRTCTLSTRVLHLLTGLTPTSPGLTMQRFFFSVLTMGLFMDAFARTILQCTNKSCRARSPTPAPMRT